MNLIGFLLYALVGFGILFVVAAILIIVFLLFEDFWRKLFRLPQTPSSPATKKNE